MQPIILRHTYTRRRDTARAGLRYYQMRPRGEGEPPRSFFTATGTASRAEAYHLLDAHQARGYLAHRLMLSPPADPRAEDLRALTRQVLGELEKEKGVALHWVAVEHRHTAHPHVHVVLCGGAETRDGWREVRLARGDHARMKAEGMAYCRGEARDRDRWDRALADAAAAALRDDRARLDARAGRDDHDR